jgi:hypothetical protein
MFPIKGYVTVSITSGKLVNVNICSVNAVQVYYTWRSDFRTCSVFLTDIPWQTGGSERIIHNDTARQHSRYTSGKMFSSFSIEITL